MNDRVRGILITPADGLLTIRRIRPGPPPYWVFPGGGVETGESDLEALRRELGEELADRAERLGGGDVENRYLVHAADRHR